MKVIGEQKFSGVASFQPPIAVNSNTRNSMKFEGYL
jgi:hypothetical protein